MQNHTKLTGRRQRTTTGKTNRQRTVTGRTNRTQPKYETDSKPTSATKTSPRARRPYNAVDFNKTSPKMKARMNEIKCLYADIHAMVIVNYLTISS